MTFRGAASALAVSLLMTLAGCGDDDGGGDQPQDEGNGGQPQERAIVDCLSEEGLTVEASNLGSDSPDIQVMSGTGEIADVIVSGSGQAAAVKGAKESFRAGQTEVVTEKDAVIVFEDAPSDDFRQQVVTCVD